VAVAIVLLVVVVAGIGVVVTLVGLRPKSRPRGGWWWSREQDIKRAAAEDVAVVREDAEEVSPDAPGNDPDAL
jgi:hypothetical protein